MTRTVRANALLWRSVLRAWVERQPGAPAGRGEGKHVSAVHVCLDYSDGRFVDPIDIAVWLAVATL